MESNLISINRRILIIDDNSDIHDDYEKILGGESDDGGLDELEAELFDEEQTEKNNFKFEIDHAYQGQEALEMVKTSIAMGKPYAMAFVDIRMPPGWDGVETLTELWKVDSNLEAVICTAYSDHSWDDFINRFDHLNKFMILKKPFDGIEVQQLAACLCEKAYLRDETERKLDDTQEQLLQSEKLASIGQLAAGVAHEINNPVGFINSNISSLGEYITDLMELLEKYAELESVDDRGAIVADINNLKGTIDFDFIKGDIVNMISESKEGVGRVKKIIQDLKDFAHVGESKFEVTNINNCIDSTINVATNEVKYKADIVRNFTDLAEIECIPHQINQVLLNLLVNASHAIKERGTITLTTKQINDSIEITVADTGCGIEKETMTKIFDPFFTTKPIGKGTGLGLSLSYGIIQKHNGSISVDSKLGEGTTFTIILPIKQEEAACHAE